MDSSPLALIKLLTPQIPSMANAALWHTLGQTATSDKWDLRTALSVTILKNFMNVGGGGKKVTVGKLQKGSLNDPGVKGKLWVANATIDAPTEETIRAAVFKAIDEMKPSEVNYTKPELVDIDVEWTGFRPSAGANEPLPTDKSEEERFAALMAEPCRTSETTILYFHGGAYYMCDPSTHRLPCSRLAKECKGRVCSVRYRLAPQGAFPSQMLDALQTYLSLIYPPPGSLHKAVDPSNIVLAGDSAGGNVAFALLQLLLQLNRSADTANVIFHGKSVSVPLPAACTANSGWLDIPRCTPNAAGSNYAHNAKYDYLPPPSAYEELPFAPDNIWPATPPRGDLFCDLTLLDHPLVSPMLAESWTTAPHGARSVPMWVECGEEMLSDEDRLVAARAASQGVKVHFEQYEAMPHCFSMLTPHLPQADRCMRSWGDFCRRAVEEPASLTTNGTWISAKDGGEKVLDVEKLDVIGLEEARRVAREAKALRMKNFEALAEPFPKPAL